MTPLFFNSSKTSCLLTKLILEKDFKKYKNSGKINDFFHELIKLNFTFLYTNWEQNLNKEDPDLSRKMDDDEDDGLVFEDEDEEREVSEVSANVQSAVGGEGEEIEEEDDDENEEDNEEDDEENEEDNEEEDDDEEDDKEDDEEDDEEEDDDEEKSKS